MKKKTPEQKMTPDEERAEKLKQMATAAKTLGNLRGDLAKIRGLINAEGSPQDKIVVMYDDGEDHSTSIHPRALFFKTLGTEQLDLATPILGALETVVREQIRKQETILREMGVTDF